MLVTMWSFQVKEWWGSYSYKYTPAMGYADGLCPSQYNVVCAAC